MPPESPRTLDAHRRRLGDLVRPRDRARIVTRPGLLAAFQQHQHRRNLRAGTIDRRHRTLLQLAAWRGEAGIEHVTRDDLETWLDSCNLSPGARYTYIGTLAAFYRWLNDTGVIFEDPTAKLDRPRLPRRLPRPMPKEHLYRAVRLADPRMKAWLLLAGLEGLRCFEIAGLRREDVHERADPPSLLVVDGKGGHQRALPLHPETAGALRPFLDTRGWLWTSTRTGRPFLPGTVSTYIARHLHIHGFTATAHQARHHFGTEVYRLSHDLRLTQELMGHADPRTTAGYAAIDVGGSAAVVKRIQLD
jgi:site-specific recombinase XerD